MLNTHTCFCRTHKTIFKTRIRFHKKKPSNIIKHYLKITNWRFLISKVETYPPPQQQITYKTNIQIKHIILSCFLHRNFEFQHFNISIFQTSTCPDDNFRTIGIIIIKTQVNNMCLLLCSNYTARRPFWSAKKT